MRILVLGATGMVGTALVDEALDRGHHVTAAARRPQGPAPRDRLASLRLDLTDVTVDPVPHNVDVVVLTVRLAPGDEGLLAPLTRRVLDAAARTAVRVIVVGGAAPLLSPNGDDLLVADDPAFVPPAWKAVAAASLAQLETCRRHASGGWVYVSPPAVLEPGPGTGRYRRGTTRLLVDHTGTSRITASDLAVAVADEIEAPGSDQHVTVAAAT